MNGLLWGWGFASDHKADAAEDAGTQEDSAEGTGECPPSPHCPSPPASVLLLPDDTPLPPGDCKRSLGSQAGGTVALPP